MGSVKCTSKGKGHVDPSGRTNIPFESLATSKLGYPSPIFCMPRIQETHTAWHKLFMCELRLLSATTILFGWCSFVILVTSGNWEFWECRRGEGVPGPPPNLLVLEGGGRTQPPHLPVSSRPSLPPARQIRPVGLGAGRGGGGGVVPRDGWGLPPWAEQGVHRYPHVQLAVRLRRRIGAQGHAEALPRVFLHRAPSDFRSILQIIVCHRCPSDSSAFGRMIISSHSSMCFPQSTITHVAAYWFQFVLYFQGERQGIPPTQEVNPRWLEEVKARFPNRGSKIIVMCSARGPAHPVGPVRIPPPGGGGGGGFSPFFTQRVRSAFMRVCLRFFNNF